MMAELTRTKEDWDKIMKMSEAKQARMNRAVALNNASAIMAAICHSRSIDKDSVSWVMQMTQDMARMLEKYLKEG